MNRKEDELRASGEMNGGLPAAAWCESALAT